VNKRAHSGVQQALFVDEQACFVNKRAHSVARQALFVDEQACFVNKRARSVAQQALFVDEQACFVNKRACSVAQQAPFVNQRSVFVDKRIRLTWLMVLAVDKSGKCDENRVQSAGERSQVDTQLIKKPGNVPGFSSNRIEIWKGRLSIEEDTHGDVLMDSANGIPKQRSHG
jgi:hypothetical protein